MPDYTITALGEDVNIFMTHQQGTVHATYDELKSLFVVNVGDLEDHCGDGKVLNEFRVEMSITGDDVDPEYWRHNLVATIYDWKQVDPEYARKGLFHWHIGGHEPCVEGYINDMVKRQRKALKNG